ncbi:MULTISPECIES: restriction endonuclease subunit S [Enterobacter cloacae complex]|uniref:restriction endonuclease subunit S n=1 Tax=Enterobacter TaxID=547 RepID=UPI000795FF9D|nr:restriction endonuclease subunit S [Enterobacter ludwigii]MBX8880096.1 restriction endonuclease subunit S [Enterobacter ludwigii]WNI44806.1 restriction endonuclease subunit S [Enterobacter ludwigii]WNI54496.1 restriction endonuclease subunit S [Enterobacter ludwigii]WNI81601.1 restriction endonuclease subunit S [Enterobacter ludwigii]SAC51123.1 restriction modification system DNA specificity domain-containing protein [Enterobacter ludwigii]
MAKYKAYPEYKDSGVEWLGAIPEDWSVTKLKYIADLLTAKSTNSDDLFVGLENISSGDGKYISKEENIADGASVSFEKNDVLFGKLRPYLAKSWLATFSGVCSSEFLVLRTAKLHPKYLNYYSLTNEFIEQVNSSTYGSKMPRANWEFIGLLPVPTCSYYLSEKVAWFLDHETAKIDNLIEKQQQLIELMKEKRQAVISHAVTTGLNPDVPMKDSGVEWLGKVPEHWKICRIKQLSKQISKGTTPSTIGGDFVDEGIRFLKAENIGKSKFVNSLPEFYITNDVDKQISRSRLQERDVLVIIAGATTGMASVLQKEILPANTNQAVSFIRTKNINHADWIYYWLGTDTIQRIIGMGAVQAAQPNLSMEDLGNIPILLPEQDELASICMEIEKQFVQFESLICKAETAIDLMQERRTALISAAVTGKIDVRDWVAPDTQDVEETQEATA